MCYLVPEFELQNKNFNLCLKEGSLGNIQACKAQLFSKVRFDFGGSWNG